MKALYACYWAYNAFIQDDPSNRVLMERTTMGKAFYYSMVGLSLLLLVRSTWRHATFTSRHVERVVYDTEKEEFTFVKRSFLGRERAKTFSRFKIMYTENKMLNKKGVNYFDIDTKEQFSLIYRDYWLRQDLFSHLISQRIKI